LLSATLTSYLAHIDEPTMESKKTVICWFKNDRNSFAVEVDPEKTTSYLKNLIVEENPQIFGTIQPRLYNLYLANIHDTEEAMGNFSFPTLNVLRGSEKNK
jgi:hypothetical protein